MHGDGDWIYGLYVIIHKGLFAACEVLDNFRGFCGPRARIRTCGPRTRTCKWSSRTWTFLEGNNTAINSPKQTAVFQQRFNIVQQLFHYLRALQWTPEDHWKRTRGKEIWRKKWWQQVWGTAGGRQRLQRKTEMDGDTWSVTSQIVTAEYTALYTNFTMTSRMDK